MGYSPSYFYGALLLGRLAALLALREISDIRPARIGAPLACMGGAALILVRSPLGIAFCAAIRLLLSEFLRLCIAEALLSIATLDRAIVPWLVGFVSTHCGSLRNAPARASSRLLAIVWFYWIPDIPKRELE